MKKQLLLTRMLLLVALLVGSVSSVWATDITYTFTSNDWNATAGGSAANWTSGEAGASMQSGRGVQVTTGASGANATSPESFSNISQIVVTYSTNASKGTGSIAFKVGSNTAKSQSVTTTGGTTDRTLTYNFNPVETGKVLMTVTCTQNSIYIKSVTISYSIGPSISASDKNIAFDATSGEFGYTLNNPVDGGVLSATENVDWISDVDVDTENKKVTFKTTANSNPTPRVGTITMTYKKDDETLATKEVKITQAKAVVKLNYSLATQVVPGRHYIITSGKNGSIKAMGAQNTNNRAAVAVTENDGKISIESDAGVYEFVIAGDETTGYYTIYDTENTGYLYAASSTNNHLKVQNELNDNGKWTISINNNGAATIKAQGTNSRNWMQYNSNNDIFACYESNTQTLVYLFERDGDTSVQEFPVTITAAKYATFASYFDLDFSGVEGLYAYTATVAGDIITFNEVTEAKAGEGLLLYSETAKTYNVPVATDSPEKVSENKLVRGTGAAVASTDDGGATYNYVLSTNNKGEVNFYRAAGKTVGTDKAFLSQISASTAKISLPGDDDETTAINELSTKHVENGKFYNLQGMEVKNPTKGIYIVNGKKVIIK